MPEINYFQAVNRQLASARFQCSLLDNHSQPLSVIQQQSCMQSSLHHLHETICYYINELLVIYRQSSIDFAVLQLVSFFDKNEHTTGMPYEIIELKNWYGLTNSGLYYVVHFREHITNADTKSEVSTENKNNSKAPNIKSANPMIIAVSNETMTSANLLDDPRSLYDFIQKLSTLINRHRETLCEH